MEIRQTEIKKINLESDALSKLYEASIKGHLPTFNSLIQQDPLILNRISLTTYNETPLHISALLGRLDFTRQLLIHKPKLASDLDSHKRSPLHLASAEGHSEVVQALLEENVGDQNMCLAKDQDGKIPLHYAALRGRTDVIKLLIGSRKESVLELTPDGETVLHLCVRYNHLEALKVLVELGGAYEDCQFLNLQEHTDGNTILHLAVMLKQLEAELLNLDNQPLLLVTNIFTHRKFRPLFNRIHVYRTVKYLLSRPGVKEGGDDIVNHRGLKALELVEHFPGPDFISDKIRYTFNDSGFANPTSLTITQDQDGIAYKKSSTAKSTKGKFRSWFRFLKYKGDWMEDKRGSVMIVSTVISTMAYQTAINPPGGVWQETKDHDKVPEVCSKYDMCLAGTSIAASYWTYLYEPYMIFNSISFFASLSIILLLTSGVRMKNKFCMFLLTLSICGAVTALAATFLIGVAMISPNKTQYNFAWIITVSGFTWMVLLAIIFLFHSVRFLYWIVKKLRRKFKPKAATTK